MRYRRFFLCATKRLMQLFVAPFFKQLYQALRVDVARKENSRENKQNEKCQFVNKSLHSKLQLTGPICLYNKLR